MSDKRDYNLLRPFDLEAAKRGEPFVFIECGELKERKFIAGPDASGGIIVQDERGLFGVSHSHPYNMTPLCWVEGKPVYKGDVLYSSFFHGMEECKDGVFEVTGVDGNGQFLAGKLSKNHATQFESCSWTQPKVKREVKLLAWIDRNGELRRVDENTPARDGWKRVPSEDKVIEVEEPAGREGD